MIVHWHPDNMIYIRESIGAADLLFHGTVSEAEAVLGETLAPLPDGIKERQYFVGSHCIDFSRKGQLDEFVIWEQGRKIVDKLADFKKAHDDKLKKLKEDSIPKPSEPVEPPPLTEEQLAKKAERNASRAVLRDFIAGNGGTQKEAIIAICGLLWLEDEV